MGANKNKTVKKVAGETPAKNDIRSKDPSSRAAEEQQTASGGQGDASLAPPTSPTEGPNGSNSTKHSNSVANTDPDQRPSTQQGEGVVAGPSTRTRSKTRAAKRPAGSEPTTDHQTVDHVDQTAGSKVPVTRPSAKRKAEAVAEPAKKKESRREIKKKQKQAKHEAETMSVLHHHHHPLPPPHCNPNLVAPRQHKWQQVKGTNDSREGREKCRGPDRGADEYHWLREAGYWKCTLCRAENEMFKVVCARCVGILDGEFESRARYPVGYECTGGK